MKKIYLVIIIFILALSMPFSVRNVHALEKIDYTNNNIEKMDLSDNILFPDEDDSDEDVEVNCEYILGDPNNPKSFAYLIQKIFDYMKIIGPILVIILSGYDFAKNALNSDADKMKKATSKLVTRLLCAIGLFFVPILTSFVINLINNTSYEQSCGIK